MNKIKTAITIIAAIMAISSCAQKSAQKSERTKTLVLYYSQTGATKFVAEILRSKLGADIDSIEVVEPYQGDFGQTIERCQMEIKRNIIPVLKTLNVDLAKYDTIYLGYPVWFGTFARPIGTLVKHANLEKKVIIPFCTFGSGGLTETTAELKKELPSSTILPGYGVRNARIDAVPDELDRFLKENHYIAGEIDALPAYSEQKPVTEQEKQIFNQACGDYQFPLGTPVTVGSRPTKKGTDYVFKSKVSFGADDSGSEYTIYVTVIQDLEPFFTRVDR